MPSLFNFNSLCRCSSMVLRIWNFIIPSFISSLRSPLYMLLPLLNDIHSLSASISSTIYPLRYISLSDESLYKSLPTFTVTFFRFTPPLSFTSIVTFAVIFVFDAVMEAKATNAPFNEFSSKTESTSICLTSPKSYAFIGFKLYIKLYR